MLSAHEEITKQNRLKIIQHCCVPKLSYLARVTPPAIAQEQLQRFDNAVVMAVAQMLHITEEELHSNDDAVIRQLQLPVRSGGFGLRPVATQINPAAYLAACCNQASDTLDMLQRVVGDPAALADWQACAAAKALPMCVEQIRAQSVSVQDADKLLPPAARSSPIQVLQHLSALPKAKAAHLQRGLTAMVDEKRARGLVATFSTQPYDVGQKQQRARLKAISAKWATAGLTMCPSQDEYVLLDIEFVIMCRLRLGRSPVPATMMPRLHCLCPSKTDLSTNFSHFLDCSEATKKRGFHGSHDLQKDLLAVVAEEGGYSVDKEVPFPDFEVKPDVVLVGRDGRVSLVDVSYVDPVARSHAGVAAGAELAAAAGRVAKKNNHYAALADHLKCEVIPFVLERFGGVSKSARDLLKEIAVQTEEVTGNKAGPLLSHFKYAFARNIHRSNAMMVRLALQNAGSFLLERLIRVRESRVFVR